MSMGRTVVAFLANMQRMVTNATRSRLPPCFAHRTHLVQTRENYRLDRDETFFNQLRPSDRTPTVSARLMPRR
jgi:hypothetical protein